jgi:hypothetical protein
MKAKLYWLAAVLPSLAGAPANADTIQLTMTGVVQLYQNDTGPGLFGPAWANISGLPFTAVFSFDTNLGQTESSPYYTMLYGGTYYGIPTPSLGTTITINGASQQIAGSYIAYLHSNQGGYTLEGQVADPNLSLSFSLGNYFFPVVLSPSPLPFTYAYEGGNDFRAWIDSQGGPRIYLRPTGLDLAPSPVPGPIVGAGLPGLLAAGGLLAWWSLRSLL